MQCSLTVLTTDVYHTTYFRSGSTGMIHIRGTYKYVCFQLVIRVATQCSVLRVKYAGMLGVKLVFIERIFTDLVAEINLRWPYLEYN